MLPLAIVRPSEYGSFALTPPDPGVRHAQLEPGKLTIGTRSVSLAPLTVVQTRYNLAVRAEAEIAAGNTVLTVLGDEGTRARWFGHSFGRDDVAVGRTRVDLSTHGPATLYTLAIARDLECDDGLLSRSFFGAAVLRRHLERAVRDGQAGRLLDFLETILEREPCKRRPIPRRVAAVHRCEKYVRENVDASPTLQELSAISGLGLRSLINAFRAVTGYSPMAYLKTQRLNAARRALSCADRTRTRIIDVAMEYGFWHMGHFASDYRALFGETPSQTLNRRESVA